jgi:hypothetical protein
MVNQTYVMNDKGMVGLAEIPDWLNFREQPHRSFEVTWMGKEGGIYRSITSTRNVKPITKEVADILRSIKE